MYCHLFVCLFNCSRVFGFGESLRERARMVRDRNDLLGIPRMHDSFLGNRVDLGNRAANSGGVAPREYLSRPSGRRRYDPSPPLDVHRQPIALC